MSVEIERKFLVTKDEYRKLGKAVFCRQGYLLNKPDCTVRVRVIHDKGFLTVKGAAQGFSRPEFEFEISLSDAEKILNELCSKTLIEKKRYHIELNGFMWHVDEFEGKNKGLVIAEVELQSESQQVVLPDWIGAEVTKDIKYLNANLAKRPFCDW